MAETKSKETQNEVLEEMAEAIVPARSPIVEEAISFEQLKDQTRKLNQFYKDLMQEGTDYGTIQGTDKPTLLKPGAELLRLWFGLEPHFEVDSTGTDLERGIFNYTVKCSLYRNGHFVADGVGNCNSLERKYRCKWVFENELPKGIDKTDLLSRSIRTRNGRSLLYRIENDNPQDLANTILKMAKKRAFIDAVLTVTGASRIFTQDVEDMVDNDEGAELALEKPELTPPGTPIASVQPAPATEAQRKRMYVAAREKGYDANLMKDYLSRVQGVRNLKELTSDQAAKIIDDIENGRIQAKVAAAGKTGEA